MEDEDFNDGLNPQTNRQPGTPYDNDAYADLFYGSSIAAEEINREYLDRAEDEDFVRAAVQAYAGDSPFYDEPLPSDMLLTGRELPPRVVEYVDAISDPAIQEDIRREMDVMLAQGSAEVGPYEAWYRIYGE